MVNILWIQYYGEWATFANILNLLINGKNYWHCESKRRSW